MREYLKKRLAVFLTIMLVLPTMISMLPMATTEVSAAGNVYMSWYWSYINSKNLPIQIEKGQEFYLGDYVYVETSSGYYVASMLKASYSSSKQSVATIDKSGYLTAKGTGITTVSVKYKGKKITAQIEVVPKGTFKKSKAITNLTKKAKAIAKKIPKEITVKNGFSLVKAEKDFADYWNSVSQEIGRGGFLKEEVSVTNSYVINGITHTYTRTYKTESVKLAVPMVGRYVYISNLLGEYGRKHSPTATNPAKKVKIVSASASTNAITLKLKSKFTAEQVLGTRIYGIDDWNKKANSKKAYGYVGIYDASTNEYYCYGKVEIKKGSNTVKITPVNYTYTNGTGKYTNTKLEKGKTYRMGNKYEWSKGKTVKVK